MPAPELSILTVASAAAWSAWLAKQGSVSPGVWLTLAKKGVTTPTSLSYAQAVDEALCHGWIDGQAKSIDATTYSHRFTPRTRKSVWSKRNVGIIARLEAEGRMKPSGMAAVAAAKADGRWDVAYDGPAKAEMPEDFLMALKQKGNERALEMFGVLTKQNLFAIYYRLNGLKTEEGKRKAFERLIGMLQRGETIHPQKARPVGWDDVKEEEEEEEEEEMVVKKTKAKAKAKAGNKVIEKMEVVEVKTSGRAKKTAVSGIPKDTKAKTKSIQIEPVEEESPLPVVKPSAKRTRSNQQSTEEITDDVEPTEKRPRRTRSRA